MLGPEPILGQMAAPVERHASGAARPLDNGKDRERCEEAAGREEPTEDVSLGIKGRSHDRGRRERGNLRHRILERSAPPE